MRTGYIDKNGYRIVTIDTLSGGVKQGLEHRFIMEKMLSRKLRKGETVHHKNGNRTDNRRSNLELWSSRHGRGVRIKDLVLYLKTIPKRLGGLGLEGSNGSSLY